MKPIALVLAAGVLLIVQSDASAWSTVKFSAGVNFFMERGCNHAPRCHGASCGMPIGLPYGAYGAPMGGAMAGPVTYGAPVAGGAPGYDGGYAYGQSGIAPQTSSFGQSPAAYPGFYPASYQTYPGYYPNFSYGR